MKKQAYTTVSRQDGVALAVALIFLLVVTIISVAAANNSVLGLKMAASLQDSYRSFQAAEAGVYATMALANTANDPFTRQDFVDDPFSGMSPHPLRNLSDNPDAGPVDVDLFLESTNRPCPRPAIERGGTGEGIFACDFYRIESEYQLDGRARSRMELGVVKQVLAGG